MKRIKINNNIVILILLIIGFLIRIDFSVQFTGKSLLTGDAISYNSIAENILNGNGFINTKGEVPVLAPLYPLFLSIFYFIFGKNFLIIQIVQILINLATVYLGYLIAKKFLKDKLAILVLIAGILYPFFIYWSRYLLTDIIFAFLNIVIIYVLFSFKKENILKFIIIGILIGITSLQRGTSIFLPVALFVYYLIMYDFRIAWRFLIVSFLIVFIFVFIWGYYNYTKYQKFIIIASYGGMSLYMGNNPKSLPHGIHYSSNKCYEEEFINSLEKKNFFIKDELCKKRAVNYILKHPFVFVKNTLIKMKVYWKEQRYGNMVSIPLLKSLNPIIRYMDTFLLFLGIIGVVFSIKEYKKYLLLYFFLLYYTFICSIFLITELARFRLPIMIPVIIFAVKGISVLYEGVKRLKKSI